MTDNELSKFTQWRFTNVRSGDKVPYPNGWQNTPLTLEQISSTNIGLLLGEQSGGIMAIDFDGTSAWTWFDEHIGCAIPTTTMWSSGKPDRCQMAFQVPNEAWQLLRTRKVVTKQASYPGAGDGEGIEFRWNGCQSVLPPSRLNDGREYVWYSTATVAELPVEILEWIVTNQPETKYEDKPYTPVEPKDLTEEKFEDVKEILLELKRHCPTLGYDDWFRVTCIVANELGDPVAELLLQGIWAENKKGEYRHKMRSRNPNRTGGVGGLIHMVRRYNSNYRRSKMSTLLNDTTSLDRINELLRKK